MKLKMLNGNVLLRKVDDIVKEGSIIYPKDWGNSGRNVVCEVLSVADDVEDIKVGDRVIIDIASVKEVNLGVEDIEGKLYIVDSFFIDNVIEY